MQDRRVVTGEHAAMPVQTGSDDHSANPGSVTAPVVRPPLSCEPIVFICSERREPLRFLATSE